MPFVKRELPAPAGGRPAARRRHCLAYRCLEQPDPETRWSAARALGGRADAVPALAAALGAEAGSARARSHHDRAHAHRRRGQRQGAAAVSPLPGRRPARRRHRGAAERCRTAISPFMAALLDDGDSDVRILATELARNMPAAEATTCCARCSSTSSIPMSARRRSMCWRRWARATPFPRLQACAERFAGTPFLPFAVSTAIARISDAEG